MSSCTVRAVLRASIVMAGALGASASWAQEVVQALDQVKAYGANDVVDMTFHDPYRDLDSTQPATPIESASAFVSCKQTSAAGLICLTADEKIVNWSDPTDGGSKATLFSCDDIKGILDTRATNTCTGVTADELGFIWLAGKNKGKTHSLVRVIGGACTASTPAPRETFTSSTSGGTYCASEWDTGRPLLLSVKRVEGQIATRFDSPLGSGSDDGNVLVGLEQRLNAVIFSADSANSVYEIPGGATGWGLGRKEALQDIALLQVAKTGGYDNFVLVTTTDGEVMAKDMANPAAVAYRAWNEADDNCAVPGAVLSLAASPKGQIVYLSNSACADVVALRATMVSGKLKLEKATERFVNDAVSPPVISNPEVPRLSTTTANAPVGITVAPGQDFQLADCSGGETEGCSQVPGFRLWNLDFVDDVAVDDGVTVLQILNIPDCRWIGVNAECAAAFEAAAADTTRYPPIHDPANTGQPSAQFLNVEALLPQEVRDVLVAKNVWTPGQLLIPPQHRAQERNGYKFDAFFFVVDDSVTFTGMFDGEFDPELLVDTRTNQPLLSRCEDTMMAPSVDTAKEWDIVTKISEQERYVSVDGLFQDMLLNTGCGSSRVKSISLSLYSFPLEITPDTYLGPGKVVEDNDAVFARYMEKLFYDLDYVARNYACNLSDGADGFPASDARCATLLSNLTNAGDKLGKCIAATYQPKQSSGNQNCTSFLQQWASVKTAIDGIVAGDASRDDPANRRNELKQRSIVFDHVYDTRFWPSVPDGGFCREQNVLSGGTQGCPAP